MKKVYWFRTTFIGVLALELLVGLFICLFAILFYFKFYFTLPNQTKPNVEFISCSFIRLLD